MEYYKPLTNLLWKDGGKNCLNVMEEYSEEKYKYHVETGQAIFTGNECGKLE